MATAALAAHADWSIDPRKRWMTLARPHRGAWLVDAPVPVGPLDTLLARLLLRAGGGAVVLGVDLPLGLPREYVARHGLAGDFPAFLRGLAGRPGFFELCHTLDQVSVDRPFYPARAVAGMTRAGHAAALGLADAHGLSRLCDRATGQRPAGAPLFWTLGANQTGRAAITAWRDLLAPAWCRDRAAWPKLWPFEGDLLALLEPGRVVLAETYPAEAMRQLDLAMAGSKRRQADRARLAGKLFAAFAAIAAIPAPALQAAIAAGCGADAAGEDRFDSILGLLCVLHVLERRRPDGLPAAAANDGWLRRWEGWALGQTALPTVAVSHANHTDAETRPC